VTLDVAAGAADSTPATLTPEASATVAYALFRAGAALGNRVRNDIVEGWWCKERVGIDVLSI
jgi:hypothetical protein